MKKQLVQLIFDKAFKYSEEPTFKLVSGRMSNYYFNCKAVTLHPEGMYLIGNIIFEMIRESRVKGIGGLTLGADPIADAVAYTSYLKNAPIEAFVVRKTAKAHGTMVWIEGNITKGDKVIIVDDVITTGKSTIEAINKAKEAGLEIVKVIALVDRQEGGKENIEPLGFKVEAVVMREEVMELYKSRTSKIVASTEEIQLKKNCWEVMLCGREQGGKNVETFGVCPAATNESLNGLHGGKNAGRACWVIAGTFCEDGAQGTFAQKYQDCIQCGFFRQVKMEEGSDYQVPLVILKKLKIIK